MITFKQFITEGGAATSKFDTERATPADIESVIAFLSKNLRIPVEELRDGLIGSTPNALSGKKKDSGDVDIAIRAEGADLETINTKMRSACRGEGSYNAGTNVGSFAVPVNGKKIQVDLMYVKNSNWAKWIYHSAEGNGSKYPGAVRNIILMTALAYTQEKGKDFVLRNSTGKAVVRASKSIKMDSGMERLFKMAKVDPITGKYAKTLEKVKPAEIRAHLQNIGHNISFSHDPDITDNPDHITEFVFGPSVKAKDVMTAEQVIQHIKKMPNAAQVLVAAKNELARLKLPIPSELSNETTSAN